MIIIKNNKCRLCGARDEMVNHLISEYIKLMQKEYSRYDRVGKVIHSELCKRLKLDHTVK